MNWFRPRAFCTSSATRWSGSSHRFSRHTHSALRPAAARGARGHPRSPAQPLPDPKPLRNSGRALPRGVFARAHSRRRLHGPQIPPSRDPAADLQLPRRRRAHGLQRILGRAEPGRRAATSVVLLHPPARLTAGDGLAAPAGAGACTDQSSGEARPHLACGATQPRRRPAPCPRGRLRTRGRAPSQLHRSLLCQLVALMGPLRSYAEGVAVPRDRPADQLLEQHAVAFVVGAKPSVRLRARFEAVCVAAPSVPQAKAVVRNAHAKNGTLAEARGQETPKRARP